uniref:HAD family hydrolase n=1 Tax=Candidatus Entotheonella serta TaxID=1652106 RepID=A0A2P1AMC7_9BACT|nr:HAD family hydrolase [Candidatus Entotheonella serta]
MQMLKQMGMLLLMTCIYLLPILTAAHAQPQAPLPSWQDTANKKAIISFVQSVSTKGGPDFVPREQRVATFDQDGTILIEKPLPVQYEHIFRFFEEPKPDPKLAIVGRKPGEWANIGNGSLLAYQYMTLPEYSENAIKFVKENDHPTCRVPYFDLFYTPMLELIQYLRANKFRVYIVSGSWQIFLRSVAKAKLGLRKSHFIGTQTGLIDFPANTFPLRIAGTIDNNLLNLNMGKPKNIQIQIGEKPILAFGNSSSDVAMLQYASTNSHKSLSLWLEHDDAEREYVYPSEITGEKDWLKISMKNDFAKVFDKVNGEQVTCGLLPQ